MNSLKEFWVSVEQALFGQVSKGLKTYSLDKRLKPRVVQIQQADLRACRVYRELQGTNDALGSATSNSAFAMSASSVPKDGTSVSGTPNCSSYILDPVPDITILFRRIRQLADVQSFPLGVIKPGLNGCDWKPKLILPNQKNKTMTTNQQQQVALELGYALSQDGNFQKESPKSRFALYNTADASSTM